MITVKNRVAKKTTPNLFRKFIWKVYLESLFKNATALGFILNNKRACGFSASPVVVSMQKCKSAKAIKESLAPQMHHVRLQLVCLARKLPNGNGRLLHN